jgi:hypothetical protein
MGYAVRETNVKPDVEYLVERFHKLRESYVEALNRATECETPDEKKCLVQEMRAITDEAKSVVYEYRNVIANR